MLEPKALLNVHVALRGRLSNLRVDVNFHNRVPKPALHGDCCKNLAIDNVVKDIFRYRRDFNIRIQTFYVPSSQNPDNEPSRVFSDFDYMLTTETWLYLLPTSPLGLPLAPRG